MSEHLDALSDDALAARIEDARARMRPVERQLAELRAERDLLLTERRRRDRLESREARAGLKQAMREGRLPTVLDLVAGGGEGAFDAYTYNLKTGGEVRLGFAGARAQTLAFTDGRQLAQARDLAEAERYYAAGWELGSPGRPGVRIHFTGTRLERVVDAADVFVRPVGGETGT
jgi:hypothetical protein